MYVSLVTNYGLVVLLTVQYFQWLCSQDTKKKQKKVDGRSILIFATCLAPLWPSGPLRSDHNIVSVPKLKYFGV